MRRVSTNADYSQDPISQLMAIGGAARHTRPSLPSKLSRALKNVSSDPDGLEHFNQNNQLARRSSILSGYHGLSINSDAISVADSTVSVCAPSVNEPILPDSASPEERAMHEFLDDLGIF